MARAVGGFEAGVDGVVSEAGGLALGVDGIVRANPPLQEGMAGRLPRADGRQQDGDWRVSRAGDTCDGGPWADAGASEGVLYCHGRIRAGRGMNCPSTIVPSLCGAPGALRPLVEPGAHALRLPTWETEQVR